MFDSTVFAPCSAVLHKCFHRGETGHPKLRSSLCHRYGGNRGPASASKTIPPRLVNHCQYIIYGCVGHNSMVPPADITAASTEDANSVSNFGTNRIGRSLRHGHLRVDCAIERNVLPELPFQRFGFVASEVRLNGFPHVHPAIDEIGEDRPESSTGVKPYL